SGLREHVDELLLQRLRVLLLFQQLLLLALQPVRLGPEPGRLLLKLVRPRLEVGPIGLQRRRLRLELIRLGLQRPRLSREGLGLSTGGREALPEAGLLRPRSAKALLGQVLANRVRRSGDGTLEVAFPDQNDSEPNQKRTSLCDQPVLLGDERRLLL